ncbi:hypothetical protein SAMN05661103_1164 [Agrobacterium sp. 719_389]|nr:hypothetical protein SAMN05661103_1164 [Agrobacterium sp. 719_389]
MGHSNYAIPAPDEQNRDGYAAIIHHRKTDKPPEELLFSIVSVRRSKIKIKKFLSQRHITW